MTPEALEASSIALAWRLQQEEQAAFYHAINENTPGAPRSAAAAAAAATPVAEAPLMAALGESGSPEDASLQLALRLQQACLPSLVHPAARPRPRPPAYTRRPLPTQDGRKATRTRARTALGLRGVRARRPPMCAQEELRWQQMQSRQTFMAAMGGVDPGDEEYEEARDESMDYDRQ